MLTPAEMRLCLVDRLKELYHKLCVKVNCGEPLQILDRGFVVQIVPEHDVQSLSMPFLALAPRSVEQASQVLMDILADMTPSLRAQFSSGMKLVVVDPVSLVLYLKHYDSMYLEQGLVWDDEDSLLPKEPQDSAALPGTETSAFSEPDLPSTPKPELSRSAGCRTLPPLGQQESHSPQQQSSPVVAGKSSAWNQRQDRGKLHTPLEEDSPVSQSGGQQGNIFGDSKGTSGPKRSKMYEEELLSVSGVVAKSNTHVPSLRQDKQQQPRPVVRESETQGGQKRGHGIGRQLSLPNRRVSARPGNVDTVECQMSDPGSQPSSWRIRSLSSSEQRRPQSHSSAEQRRPQSHSSPEQRRPQSHSSPEQRRPQSHSSPEQRRPQSHSSPEQRRPQSHSSPEQRRPQSHSSPEQRRPQSFSSPGQRSASKFIPPSERQHGSGKEASPSARPGWRSGAAFDLKGQSSDPPPRHKRALKKGEPAPKQPLARTSLLTPDITVPPHRIPEQPLVKALLPTPDITVPPSRIPEQPLVKALLPTPDIPVPPPRIPEQPLVKALLPTPDITVPQPTGPQKPEENSHAGCRSTSARPRSRPPVPLFDDFPSKRPNPVPPIRPFEERVKKKLSVDSGAHGQPCSRQGQSAASSHRWSDEVDPQRWSVDNSAQRWSDVCPQPGPGFSHKAELWEASNRPQPRPGFSHEAELWEASNRPQPRPGFSHEAELWEASNRPQPRPGFSHEAELWEASNRPQPGLGFSHEAELWEASNRPQPRPGFSHEAEQWEDYDRPQKKPGFSREGEGWGRSLGEQGMRRPPGQLFKGRGQRRPFAQRRPRGRFSQPAGDSFNQRSYPPNTQESYGRHEEAQQKEQARKPSFQSHQEPMPPGLFRLPPDSGQWKTAFPNHQEHLPHPPDSFKIHPDGDQIRRRERFQGRSRPF